MYLKNGKIYETLNLMRSIRDFGIKRTPLHDELNSIVSRRRRAKSVQ